MFIKLTRHDNKKEVFIDSDTRIIGIMRNPTDEFTIIEKEGPINMIYVDEDPQTVAERFIAAEKYEEEGVWEKMSGRKYEEGVSDENTCK